jgi:zinc protease
MIRAFLTAFFMIALTMSAHARDKVLDVQVIKTKSGIEAWLVEDKTVPVVSMNFSFDGGLALDPDDKPGVGKLVSIMMDEGAGEMMAQEFQKKLSDHAIGLSFTPGRDAFHGEMKTLKTNIDMAADMLAMALTAPRFDPDALTRMKNANTSSIRNDLGDPSWLVARSFNGMVFQGHYYSRPGAGHLESMENITRRDLLDFVEAQFARNVLKVAIAGDISKEEAEALVERIFARLPEKADIPATVPAKLQHAGQTILLQIATPQTYISIGGDGISRDDPQWHAAVVMNFILGGGSFDARLMREIREKRGLTYGVYSSINTMKNASLFQVSMSGANEKIEEALDVMRSQFSLMAEKGVTAEELSTAKSYLTGSLLLELTSTSDITETLNALQRDGESPDYINKRNALINAVTAAEAQAVAKRILKPENMTTVLVGKPINIKTDILLDKPPGMKEPQE